MSALKIIVFALSVISFGSATQPDTLECPKVCPDLHLPVCATDGSDHVQFENACELSIFNCKRQRSLLPTYSETVIDWCTTTELVEERIDLETELAEADPSCFRPCPLIFSPICASNGTFRKVFSNECEMNMFNCIYKTESKSSWRSLKEGSC